MKNLFNVSPFILLLIPVFVVMILTFTINSVSPVQGVNTTAKTTVTTTNSLAKTNILLSK